MKLGHLFQIFILPILLFAPIGTAHAGQGPTVITSVNPASVNVGETAIVSVSLNYLPSGGYSSAEFTCTYNANLVEASNIVVTDLFGANPVTAINGPQGGKFILAIAGNKGNKASTGGVAFTFSLKGLQAGQIAVECTARASKGDKVLSSLPSIGASLNVLGNVASPTPSSTPAASTKTPFPSITPGGPTATATPGVAFDFVANACSATWLSGAGQLPCPGTDGDPRGFIIKLDHPLLENGIADTRSGLLTVPQNTTNGYIQGIYQPFRVQSGDRFHATIGCEGNATDCYVVYRLEYAVAGNAQINTFWAFVENYNGFTYNADIDLSALAGQDIKFILTVLSNGSATGDRALWVAPTIYRTDTNPAISGQVLARKPVTINLYRADDSLAVSGAANSDGRFNIKAPAGTYSIVASANGSLSARGSITLSSSGTNTMQIVIDLPAGDIDGNNFIDQYDALTIGMNYNGSTPAVADLNNDGIINILDLEILALYYHKGGPLFWQ